MEGLAFAGLTSCSCRKFQCLPNSQLREININFGLVDTFAPEVLVHRLHRNALVVDRGLRINIEPTRLS
jgi:hypothetical protein